MPDRRRSRCQSCGRRRADGYSISWTGLCRDCALAAVDENLEALETRSGYNYLRWARGMARAAEQALLDAGAVDDHTSPRHA